VLLALRTQPASDANWLDVATHNVITARLVTAYPHGGIAIDGWLFHSTARRGVHCLPPGEWTPSRWELREFGGDDAEAVRIFRQREGFGYDWVGLLPFVGIPGSDRHRDYCFELCWHMRTRERPRGLVTAETLLALMQPAIIHQPKFN
jgi:hypothetical protein